MERGYVNLWRKTEDSGLLQHPKVFAVFGWLLLHAAWKPFKYATRYGVIDVKRGQVVTGRIMLAGKLNQSERNIRTALQMLSTMQIVTIESTSHFSVITLVNYDKYQTTASRVTSEMTKPRPSLDQASTTEEALKHSNIEKLPDGFDAFWTPYPRKVAKQAALKAWQKLAPDADLQATMKAAVEVASKDKAWLKDAGAFIPHPATWLNGRRWEDVSSIEPCANGHEVRRMYLGEDEKRNPIHQLKCGRCNKMKVDGIWREKP